MSYRVQVSGKIFEGDDLRTLLKRAVEARQDADHRPVYSREQLFTQTPPPSQIDSQLRKTGKGRMAYPQGI